MFNAWWPTVMDVLQVVLLTTGVYYAFMLLKGTRAAQMLLGVGALFLGIFLVTSFLDLDVVNVVLQWVTVVLLLALLVVFQPELRRILSLLGRNTAVQLMQGKLPVTCVLTIPAGYGRDLGSGRAAPRVQITANAVNAAKAQIGASYLSQLTAAQAVPTDGRRLAVQYRYNPTLDYRAYMIPALMTLLLLILCGVLPALNIVSEKEIGTIEQINVTPVGRLAFTMGKLIPFWAIGLVAVGVGIAVGGLVYGVWPAGSLWLILLASLLFTSVVSGFGLVVSNYSTTLRQALFVIYFFVMIFILMGGLFTPVASMPRWAQAVTYALPTRYYGEAMRALYLKGSTLADLLPQFGALALMAAGLGAWAVGSYRKTE